jgi:hypothetical protein
VSEKLQQKLTRMGHEVNTPERLYKSGYAEAWSWHARLADGSAITIGSGFSMTECVAMPDSELEKVLE